MRARIVAEVAALRDAERALIEQARELQRSNAELEQFAYVASHDLQEPLRKVASFTQMLQRRYGGQLDERADQYIEFAVDGAERMQDLINDLLEFSRVGRMTRPHELDPATSSSTPRTARLAASIEDAGGEVVVHGELPTSSGDRGAARRRLPEPDRQRDQVPRRGAAADRDRRGARRPRVALRGGRQRHRRRRRVRRAHLRHLPAPAHARRLRGHGHRPGDVPKTIEYTAGARARRRPNPAAARASCSLFRPSNPGRRSRMSVQRTSSSSTCCSSRTIPATSS